MERIQTRIRNRIVHFTGHSCRYIRWNSFFRFRGGLVERNIFVGLTLPTGNCLYDNFSWRWCYDLFRRKTRRKNGESRSSNPGKQSFRDRIRCSQNVVHPKCFTRFD